MIPVNLGQRGMTIGRVPQMPAQMMPKGAQMQGGPQPQPVVTNEARDQALAAVLADPVSVDGGGWGEAVAEALSQGLRGRALQRSHQMEIDEANRGRKEEDQRERGYAEALGAFQSGGRDAAIATLGQTDAETALSLALEQQEAPDVRVTPSGTFWQQGGPEGYQVLGRDPNWQPPAQMIYQPPAGYRGSPEAGLEPIPGGPADVRQTAEGRSRIQQMESSARQLDNAIAVLDEALPDVNGGNSGFWGGLTRAVPGSSAYDLNQQLEPVRAILSFENLAEMRRNSTTGGALGSIAVRELELLGNTVRSLDTAQSRQQLTQALRTTRSQLARTRAALDAARAEMGGGAPAEQTQGAAPPATSGLDTMSVEQLEEMRRRLGGQ